MTTNLDTIELKYGGHNSPEDGMCLLEACSYIAGEPFSDHPQCVSPVLGAYGRRLNDRLGDADRQKLIPYIPGMLNTANDGKDDARRYILGDWAYRTAVPRWLDLAGNTEGAQKLRDLPPVTDLSTLTNARNTLRGLYQNLATARREAYAKLRAAVRSEIAKNPAAEPAEPVVAAVAVAAAEAEAAEAAAAAAEAAEAAEAAAAAAAEAEAAAAAAGKSFDYWTYRTAVRDALRAKWDAEDPTTPGTFAYVRHINKTEGIELFGRLITAA